MKRNWPMFVATNVVGIAVGTVAAIGVLYLFGEAVDTNLVTYCFLITTAICLYGSLFLWPDIWQKKS